MSGPLLSLAVPFPFSLHILGYKGFTFSSEMRVDQDWYFQTSSVSFWEPFWNEWLLEYTETSMPILLEIKILFVHMSMATIQLVKLWYSVLVRMLNSPI